MKNMNKLVLMNRPKIPQMPLKFICPNCLPKSKKFGISMKKKASLGIRSPWLPPHQLLDISTILVQKLVSIKMVWYINIL